jgi:predicted hydrocarbon binding protein
MQRLECHFNDDNVIKIRLRCQCGYDMDDKLSFLQKLMESSKNMEEFANHEKAKAAGLSILYDKLHLHFPFCPCPMLAEVVKLDSITWCQCTTGYSKVLFEQAFGCPVDVTLLKSVKMGDDVCLMKIEPLGVVWE